jgi:coniferyl-aldehyde dehydrogenase
VPLARRDEFVDALRREITSRYAQLDANPDYTHIVNEGQYRRLCGLLDDARTRGHEVITLIEPGDTAQKKANRLLPPTLVIDPDDDAKIMQEEVFGPILPVKTYRMTDEAIAYINAHDRPLAFYCFSNDRTETEKMLGQIVAGGVCINETLLHNVCNDLPFGGVGASGMGHYHGHDGFLTFSKAMPVLYQARIPLTDRLKPPYKRLADLAVKLFAR